MGFSTAKKSLFTVLNEAAQGLFDRALAQVKLGRVLQPVKVTVTGLAAAAAHDITSAATLAGATVDQGLDDIAVGEALPPILAVRSLRVTAVGTGALGPRSVFDSGATPGAPGATGPGIAKLSDDGTTITFEGTVTGFVIEYIPRSNVDLGTEYVLS